VRDASGAEALAGLQIRLNPDLARVALRNGGRGQLTPQMIARLFVLERAPATSVRFLYAMFDEATGRAFQSEPLLSTAGLGSPDGDRPFRQFPTPITFAQRSTIRLEITELTETPGELHVTLHGYKTVGASLESRRRRLGARTRR
jgi:hypothetical protein